MSDRKVPFSVLSNGTTLQQNAEGFEAIENGSPGLAREIARERKFIARLELAGL